MGLFKKGTKDDGKMKNTMKKPLSIIADPGLAMMGLIYTVVISTIFIGAILYFCINGDKHDVIGVLSTGGTLEILLIIVIIWVLPQWYVKITFLPDGVRIKPARKKPTERPYKYYQYVYKAYYWHGSPIGIGTNVYYIVVSHRRLKDNELCNINQLASSADVIKIKYSPKTYQTLMNTLPSEMAYKLKVCRFE